MRKAKRFFVDSANVQLAGLDYGGSGPPAMLLHGLYGNAHEWREVASWLTDTHHVFALDQRGHGQSAKGLADFSREAFVDDAVNTIEHLDLGPVLLIGQSMGALNALVLAARAPDLVAALILVETCARGGEAETSTADWISEWPVPFKSLKDATEYFARQGMSADVWLASLVKHEDGYWPNFRNEDMRAISRHLTLYDFRSECRLISARTLVVGGSRSWLDRAGVQEVAQLIPSAEFMEIANAGHDVHLDAPDEFRQAVKRFIV